MIGLSFLSLTRRKNKAMSDGNRIQSWVNILRAFGLEELRIIIDAIEIVKEELNINDR